MPSSLLSLSVKPHDTTNENLIDMLTERAMRQSWISNDDIAMYS